MFGSIGVPELVIILTISAFLTPPDPATYTVAVEPAVSGATWKGRLELWEDEEPSDTAFEQAWWHHHCPARVQDAVSADPMPTPNPVPASPSDELRIRAAHPPETDPALTGGRAIPIAGDAGDQQAALYGQKCWTAGTASTATVLFELDPDAALDSPSQPVF